MPIDIASGVVKLDYQDVAIPGKLGLIWNRHYSTALLDRSPTPLGRGWTCRYYSTLTISARHFVFESGEGAREIVFDEDDVVSGGGVARNLSAFLEVFRRGAGYVVQSWDVDTDEVRRYCFADGTPGEPWPLTSIEDVSGQALDLDWDRHGRLLCVRQRLEKRELIVQYDTAGYLIAVALNSPTNTLSPLVRYKYDRDGLQIAAVDAMGFSDRLEYDRNGRVLREHNKDSGHYYYRYDGNGRCVLRAGVDHYNEKRLRYIDSLRLTEVTNSYDEVYRYTHLPTGQAVSVVDPSGGTRTTDYDEHGRIAATTDATGATTRYEYDDRGNRAVVTDALGNITRFTFDDHHQPLTFIDALGHTWRRIYDDFNRLIATVDPLGNRWQFGYDGEGNIHTVTNPKGERRYEHYRGGVLQVVTDWLQNRTFFTFDDMGRVVERRGPLGETTRVRYDAVGNAVRVELPGGATMSASYDHAGNLTQFVDANGGVTRWRYGPCSRLIEHADAAGGKVRYVWGSESGRLERLINERGETYSFERDDGGRIVKERTFAGALRVFEYNPDGHVVSYTNGNGETIRLERDPLHRVVAQVLPDGERLGFTFDAAGNLVRAVSRDTAVAFERDALGRIVRERQGSEWVASTYDAIGALVRTETSLGHEVSYKIDANGFVASLRARSGDPIEFERTPFGQETARTLGGLRLTQSYDTRGRLTAQRITQQDATAASAGTMLRQRQYSYEPNGAVASIDAGASGRTQYSYDPAERVIAALRDRGTSEQFSYDGAGNLLRVAASGRNTIEEGYEYQAGSRLVRRGSTAYEYDSDGRRTRMLEDADSESAGEWRYEWNALGRLMAVTRPDGQVWAYQYDALGRRVGKRGPGKSTRFLWDREVIVQETVQETTSGTALSTAWVFDSHSFTPVATVQNARTYAVITDHIGTPTEIFGAAGDAAWALSSRTWGQPDEEMTAGRVSCPLRFPGQWRDDESGLHYNNQRYYDPECAAFVSEDPISLRGGINLYAYARNPTSYSDPLGLCPDPAAPATPPVNVLPSSGSVIVVTPNGVAIVTPAGSTGPVPVTNPAGKVTGFAFVGGSGGPGMDPRVASVRIMDPVPAKGSAPAYPNGYATYQNGATPKAQGVDPATGQTLPNNDPRRHQAL